MITLDKILERLKEEGIVERYSKNLKFENIDIKHLSYNSNDIKEKTLFICKGKHFKTEYLNRAIEQGTTAYISEEYYEEIQDSVAYIVVNDIRKAMTLVANIFYEYAWKDIKVVGITGTKGKTTTTYYMKNILDRYLKKGCAIISTINTYTGKTNEKSHLTTPEAPDLHRFFYETKQSGIPVIVMEVASQGYKTKRIDEVKFDIGVFLNISEDHISDAEHPNFEDYLNCKLEFIRNCKTVIINRNTDFYESVKDAAKNATKIITYGTDNRADYYVQNVCSEEGYTKFDVVSENEKKSFKTKMLGKFNAENALAAIIISKELGVDDENIFNGISETKVVGRMSVFEKNGVTVIVDYAHNKLSFTKLYEAINQSYPGRRVISLGGGVGEKAYTRRKDFGEIVGKNSEYVYLTSDDPQFEDVNSICMDMASYMEKGKYEIIEDRKEAVLKALKNSKKGDAIVLLSKGEEPYQKIKGKLVPYESDLKLVEEWQKEK